jgi:hypothetical protein
MRALLAIAERDIPLAAECFPLNAQRARCRRCPFLALCSPTQGYISPDCYWNTPNDGLCGIFLYGKDDRLAGLEVWSVDGKETPSSFAAVEQLCLDCFDMEGV